MDTTNNPSGIANTNNSIDDSLQYFETLGGGLFDLMLHSVTFMGDTAVETSIEEKKEEVNECDACERCRAAGRRARYCCNYSTHIGNDCMNSRVVINGVDFNDLLERLSAVERYIVAREVERQTKLPTAIAIEIAQYF